MVGGNSLFLAFLLGTKMLVRYTVTFIHLHYNIIVIIIRIPSIIKLVKFISQTKHSHIVTMIDADENEDEIFL